MTNFVWNTLPLNKFETTMKDMYNTDSHLSLYIYVYIVITVEYFCEWYR